MSGFQTSINQQQAPGIEGDFCSANPRASVVTGEGALIAGAAGVTVGRFAWADSSGVVLNTGVGAPTGFVHREMQAVITVWLAESSMVIPGGRAMTLMRAGDFWGRFAAGATAGQKVFASTTDGSLLSAAAGATVSGSVETSFFVRSTALSGEVAKISTWA